MMRRTRFPGIRWDRSDHVSSASNPTRRLPPEGLSLLTPFSVGYLPDMRLNQDKKTESQFNGLARLRHLTPCSPVSLVLMECQG